MFWKCFSMEKEKMKIGIATDEENRNITTMVDISNPKTKGEVAHYLAELEIIKKDLLQLWKDIADWEE